LKQQEKVTELDMEDQVAGNTNIVSLPVLLYKVRKVETICL